MFYINWQRTFVFFVKNTPMKIKWHFLKISLKRLIFETVSNALATTQNTLPSAQKCVPKQVVGAFRVVANHIAP